MPRTAVPGLSSEGTGRGTGMGKRVTVINYLFRGDAKPWHGGFAMRENVNFHEIHG